MTRLPGILRRYFPFSKHRDPRGLRASGCSRLQLEPLEDRRLLAFTSTLAGSTATITGDGSSDTFIVDVSGGNLRHNRATAGDAGFASDLDWDTVNGGVQSLAAVGGSFLNFVDLGGGDDTLTLGTASVAASSILARIQTSSGGAGNDRFNINDSARASGNTYIVDDNGGTNSITATGINIDNQASDFENGITLTMSSAANTINILHTSSIAPLTVNGGASADTFNVTGTGLESGALNLNGLGGTDTFNLAGLPAPTVDLNIDGGAQADSMNLFVDVDTIRHFLDTPSSGRVEFDLDSTDNGGAAEVSVDYVGLEPIGDNGNAVNRVFDFGAGNDTDVVLRDGPGASNIIEAPANAESVTFANPTGSLTVNLGSGADIMEVRSFDAAWVAPTININGEDENDEIRIGASPAVATMNVNTNNGTPDRTIIGRNINTGNAIAFAEFNTSLGTLDGIAGVINVDDSGGVGELFVDDSGDTDPDAVTFTSTAITGAAPAAINYNGTGSLRVVQLALSRGVNTVNVNSTAGSGGSVSTTIFGNDGNDLFTINGDALQDVNNFQGGLGNDLFTLNIAANLGAAGGGISSLQIEGNDPAANSANRDRLTINDNNAAAARQLNYQYLATAGDLNIAPLVAGAGLAGAVNPALALNVRTMETVVFNAAGAANDVNQVTGTTGNDVLTVALLNTSAPNGTVANSSALVFLNGTPYLGPPPVTIADSRPGVAGGGNGPDLLINGIAPASGLLLDGGGIPALGGDRAVVYGASESNLVDVGNATNIFGFGAGVLQPGFGVNNAYDTVTVDTSVANTVVTSNNSQGALVNVRLNVPTFVQGAPPAAAQQAALIVDGGNEAAPQATGIADRFNVALSSSFNIQVNGNLPNLTLGPFGEPLGDELNVAVTGSINVFSDAANPPNVTVTGLPVFGPFGVNFSSIERSRFTPSNGIVNIIGDNNDPAATQNDYFKVRGTDVDFNPAIPFNGQNEFTLQIGGNWVPAAGTVNLSPPILFKGVTRINAVGGAASSFDVAGNVIPEVTNTGVDALDIRAYADNTPRGWGIETFFNEGDPVEDGGLGVDLLIFNGIAGVSDKIVVQPSAPEAGQVSSINAATGTPIAVVNYVLNTNIIVNGNDGSAGDTDTLTLRGTNGTTPLTSGNETVTADFNLAGGPGTEWVSVNDTNGGAVLYKIQSLTNIQTVDFELLGGKDRVTLQQRTQAGGVKAVNLSGGSGDDTFTVVPAGGIIAGTDSLEIDIDGGDPQASDALVVAAAGGGALGANQFVVLNRGRNPDTGTIRVFTNTGPGPVADPDIAYKNVEIVSPNVALVGGKPNLLILGPDLYEPNEFQDTAAFLGSGPNLQIQHASIFPNSSEHPGVPADLDFYRVVAEKTGTLDFQVYFRLFDPALLPGGGELGIQVLDAAGNVIGRAGAGQVPLFGTAGAFPATPANARVRVPVVAGQSYYLRVFGRVLDLSSQVVNGYDVTIINAGLPVPTDLELSRSVPPGVAGSPDTGDLPADAPGDDTGRSQFDDVTRINNPTIFLRLEDAIFLQDLPGNQTPGGVPPMGSIPIPFNPSTALDSTDPGFRIAVYDGGNGLPAAGNPHAVDPNDSTFLGFAQPVPGVPRLYSLKIGSQGPAGGPADSLADGLHFITARTQFVDPANPAIRGFGDRSQSLKIVVDTVPPPVTFSGIHPSSDTGLDGDGITSNTVPLFFGRAEANAIIRMFVEVPGDEGPVRIPIGLAVAIPLDGTNAFPNGSWGLVSTVDLNDPILGLPLDGERTLIITAEDLAGNLSEELEVVIFLDTQGPQVTGVFITDAPDYNLFGLKPNNQIQGPTPLVNSLTINLQDLPERVAAFLYNAIAAGIASTPGVISVRGDQNGLIAISQIIVTNNPPVAGEIATASIELVFAKPLPDDRFTLVVSDSITDPSGNRLDGESNASEPQNLPQFPSGDGVPGGAFVARFTVDTRPEIGFYAGLHVVADINGNGFLDLENVDATNRDLMFQFGDVSDQRFAGKLSPNLLPGFDVLAVYGKFNGSFRFWVDLNGDGGFGGPGEFFNSPVQVSALAVAGDFDQAAPGDEVALFTGTTWYILTSGLGGVATSFAGASAGYPLAGDFDGDGNEDLATYQNDQFFFDFGPGFGGVGAQIAFGAPGVKERPVAADMDGDGIDDIGLWIPNTGTDLGTAEWRFLISNDFAGTKRIAGQVNTLIHPFAPVPLGADLTYRFGDQTALPIVGNFDPPIATPAAAQSSAGGSGLNSPATPASTLTTNQKIVVSLYQDILGRAPDAAGLSQYTSQLNAGITRAAIAQTMLSSAERFGKVVDQLYDTYLHRKADAAGRAHWVGTLLGGGTEEAVAASFMLSSEYAAMHVGNTEFVKALYRDVLGRGPDSPGQAAHVSALAGGKTRAELVATFLSSEERFRRIVDQLYGQFYQRHADLTGMVWHASKLKSGEQTVRSLAQSFVAADEYFAQL